MLFSVSFHPHSGIYCTVSASFLNKPGSCFAFVANEVLESRKSANNDFPGKVKHHLPYYSKLIRAELKSYP